MFRNEEGYPDPTGYSAVTKADRQRKNERRKEASQALEKIRKIAAAYNFSIRNAVVFQDKNTGEFHKIGPKKERR